MEVKVTGTFNLTAEALSKICSLPSLARGFSLASQVVV